MTAGGGPTAQPSTTGWSLCPRWALGVGNSGRFASWCGWKWPQGAAALLPPAWMGYLRGSGMTHPGMGTFFCHRTQAAPGFPWEVWDGPRMLRTDPLLDTLSQTPPFSPREEIPVFLNFLGVAFFVSSFSRSPECVGIAGLRCGVVGPVHT